MEDVYIIGAFIFVCCLMSEGLKKALIAFLGWCAFWKLLQLIFMRVGETGKLIVMLIPLVCLIWVMLERKK